MTKLLGASLLLATTAKVATAKCSVDDHHPVNGGYHIEGIAGYNKDEEGKRLDDPNSGVEYFYPWHDATWAPDMYVRTRRDDGACRVCDVCNSSVVLLPFERLSFLHSNL